MPRSKGEAPIIDIPRIRFRRRCGSSADDEPVRYVDCAAMSSYRNKSIEKLHIDIRSDFYYRKYRCTLDILIKLRDNPCVTCELNI